LDDLEAVLAHELAHIRRRDFAKNLVYEAISIAVAWHPLAALTRARLAESREMVCDAIAADAVAGRESYARSLLRMASMVAHDAPARTLHAIGIFDANSFERRVMKLTRKPVEMKTMQRIGIAAACAVVAMATCATALALRVEVEPRATAVSASDEKDATALPKVDVTTMKTVSRTMPIYPAEAKKDPIDGPVVFDVTIGKDGSIQALRLKKSLREDYDKSAWDAVKTWRWEPYLLNGEPTEVDTTVTVTYSAPHDEK
jgi:TonB family protein